MSTKANRGHDAPSPFRVYRSGQKRGVHGVIRKQLRRRAAIEAVIGHLKIGGHISGATTSRAAMATTPTHAVVTAVGHNLRLALRWLRAMLSKIVTNIPHALITISTPTKAS